MARIATNLPWRYLFGCRASVNGSLASRRRRPLMILSMPYWHKPIYLNQRTWPIHHPMLSPVMRLPSVFNWPFLRRHQMRPIPMPHCSPNASSKVVRKWSKLTRRGSLINYHWLFFISPRHNRWSIRAIRRPANYVQKSSADFSPRNCPRPRSRRLSPLHHQTRRFLPSTISKTKVIIIIIRSCSIISRRIPPSSNGKSVYSTASTRGSIKLNMPRRIRAWHWTMSRIFSHHHRPNPNNWSLPHNYAILFWPFKNA